MCAGAGSGGRFRKVPESSGVCYCRFRRQVPESSGVRCGVGTRGRDRKVPESYGVVFLPCNLDRSSHVIVLNTFR